MKHDRHILTKHGSIAIPEGAEGIPIKDAWPNTKIPDSLKGALVYTINGREVIAKQDKS